MAAITQTDIENCLALGYTISTDKRLLDVDAIYNFLVNESYWAKGLADDRFKRSVEHSLCFGIYKNGAIAGFARVITDRATFAYICDVFVTKAHRGQGLGKWLIHTIINHPELEGLRRWSLATMDAHGLYEQFGFTPLSNPERWLQLYRPYDTQQI